MTTTQGGAYLTPGEAAARIGSTSQHVRQLVKAGRLPGAIDISNGTVSRFRIPESAVAQFLEAAVVAPDVPAAG